MIDPTIKITWFWKELKRRKVITVLIAYLAGCLAVIEFVDITANRFNIPNGTVKILYLIAIIGLPFAIAFPWFMNRKKEEEIQEEPATAHEKKAEPEKPELHNLPAQVTSFIGREKEIPVVRQLISEHRLVSLVGAGGCGKTRLACEVAEQLVPDFRDGVWFVDLSPISDENLVAKEITEVLNIPEVPNQSILDTLIEKTKKQELLIILDNCEHLVKPCGEIAGKLVQSVPGLKILVTSRESLCIKGENVWRVPSLTLIDPRSIIDVERAKDSEAVMMFTDRARMNNPEFELESGNVSEVVTICNKLDGIPLALELVASRTRHMNTKMILDRFADRFDQLSSSDPGTSKRQQTLHATIEWSFNLLSEEEKLLFTRLAVFVGGFDLEAAEEVCSDDQLPKESILDTLSRLVDRSLVYTSKGSDQSMRYSRLEILRQYALQKIQVKNEEEVIRKRHLHYQIKIAEQAYNEQFEAQLKWQNKLELEHDNLMAALNWSYAGFKEDYLLLTSYLGWFWINRSHLQAGKEYMDKALSVGADKSEAYARNLCARGGMVWYDDTKLKALDYLKESLEIWGKVKNLFEEVVVLQNLGMMSHSSGDFEASLKYSQQSLEIARKIGKPGLINACLKYVCMSLTWSKEYEQVRPLLGELLISSEKLEQPVGIMTAHHFLGDSAQGTGNFKEAEKEYNQVITLAIKYGIPHQVGIDMQGVAFALAGQKRWAKSIRVDAASRKIADQYGFNTRGMAAFWDEWIDTYLEGARKEVGEELAKKYEEEGRAMGFEKAVEYAMDFDKD